MHLSHVIRQKSYERVEYALRRHWLTFVPAVFLFILLLGVPLALYALINSLFPAILNSAVIFPIAVLLGSVYYLFTYLFFYVQFIDYYLDLWVITNDRVVDIEQHGLFDRVTTELDLFRIQDVTSNVKGVLPTVFHYGDVTVTTASSNSSIVFRQIPRPDHVRQELIRLADEDRKYHLGDIKSEN
ncbi:MAG: hypothetical protein UY92_C0010G0004 [Candidatus Magasanikbacteria bacterium GW2011_GWA2_56_11]|uniref:YdbS-like PH domain-containing protein n=1 Tax=Candidatus Magasanikbacteria bacterium GW2011_GWA2_56_11 TaxID=1619044 RepID=A0A0G1YF47_9BACT|nr:MAG: hypothetical protein UY92_C0010G0004 [Candidatus Magasanikbacteria bacterium GW2011_GWA2_56_11]